MNSLNFCLSVTLLISPQIWKRSYVDRVFLVIGFSFSSLYKYSWHFLLVEIFLSKYQVLALWASVAYVAFPLLLLSFVLCIYFFLVWLICVLMSFSLYLSCIRLSASWTLVAISFPILGKFLVISSNTFSWPFLLSSGTPIIWMLGCFMWSQRSLRLSSFFTLFLYSSLLQLLPAFYVSAHLSILLPQLLDCWFPLEHFYSQLLHCSLLTIYSLILPSPCQIFTVHLYSCLQFIYPWLHFVCKILEHLYYHWHHKELHTTEWLTLSHFLLSLFWIIFQVDSLSLPHLSGLVGFTMFLHLMHISLSFHFVYFIVLGFTFCRLDGCSSS